MVAFAGAFILATRRSGEPPRTARESTSHLPWPGLANPSQIIALDSHFQILRGYLVSAVMTFEGS